MSGNLTINRNMWKKSSKWIGPIYQMTRLMSTLGLAIGPQVVKPFLGHDPTEYEGIQPVVVAYLVMAACDLFMAIILIIATIWFCVITDQFHSIREVIFQVDDGDYDTELTPDESDAPSNSELLEAESQPKKLDPFSRPGRILLSLIFWSFIMNAGTSIMYTALMYTYLYEYLGWTVQDSTFLTSMFNVFRFIIGVIVVFASRWVSPTQLVIVDMASMLLSSIMMLVALFEEDGGDILTGAGVMVASIGDSNILPSLISLAEESMYVIARVMSLFITANGVSLMVIGPLAGALLSYSVVGYPSMLLALVLACIVALAVYYSILYWLKRSGHWPQ